MWWHQFCVILLYICVVNFSIVSGSYRDSADCFEKWLQGYRLASGRPQRIFSYLSLEKCQDECVREVGCAAIAYGILGSANGTCELALRTIRDSRSVGNASLPYAEIKKAPDYDIYMMTPNCEPKQQRQPLFSGSNSLEPVSGHGVPIDCFYRLMSGKRLERNLVTRSISVNGLQECQEACIADRECSSISYRYMTSGYTYNVANCELSTYHITNYEDSYKLRYDFIDDYDYDYFQREPHCRTTSRLGSFGVCAVVVKQGAKLAPSLIKSSHETSTATQCEFLCSTASRFRCRAFAVRHTTRGRDAFHRDSRYETACVLYDVDISRLPQYDITPDPDYDIYEIGRLMGAECILQDQFLNRRPSDNFQYTHYPPSTSQLPPTYPPQYYDPPRPRIPADHYDSRYDYHSRRPSVYPEDKTTPAFPRPGPGLMTDTSHPSYTQHRPHSGIPSPISDMNDLPFYDKRREACLVKTKQDVYLSPEVTRATFPTKSLEECRIECIRAYEVLKFVCRVLSFRMTSSSGGTCQLSEFSELELRANDYIQARDRYENAIVCAYDERDSICRREVTVPSRYPPPSDFQSYDRNRDRYGTGNGYQQRWDSRYGMGSATHLGPTRPQHDYYDDRRYPIGDRGKFHDTRYGERPTQSTHSRDPYGTNTGFASYPTVAASYLPPREYPSQMSIGQSQTVNGEKCLRSCVKDREAGFYYCVIDNRGTWDFCCRPDHFCGYSRGLSVPWCYVGEGPTAQVWRSCNQRQIGSTPPVSYLHDRPPPKVHSLSNDEVASLSKDNALKFFKTSLSVPPKNNADFEDIDAPDRESSEKQEDIATKFDEKGSASTLNSTTEVFYGNNTAKNSEIPSASSRQGRASSKNPTFTIVEVRRSSSQ